MTATEIKRIEKMRKQAVGAAGIARTLNLSVNTVKSYCRRHPLPVADTKHEYTTGFCKLCGKSVEQNPGRKTKWFCSDTCRMAWWNSHRGEVTKKSAVVLNCEYCGRRFDSYEKEHRKFCSHRCYISRRFGGDPVHDKRAV